MSSEEVICSTLFEAFPTWSWRWDDRFGAVLAEFGAADQVKVRDVLIGLFAAVWDQFTIDTAPDAVQKMKSHFGGLMPGQLLFGSDPGRESFLCCAWWPWANGKTVSLRIAPVFGKDPGAEGIQKFKGRFGL